MDKIDLTQIERHGDYYVKRDDLFVINNVCGGKARVVNELVARGMHDGQYVFVSCGSRDSRQCEVVAKICEKHNVECHLFMPSGADTDIIKSIKNVKNATIHRTKVGYNSVLISHSKKFAEMYDFFYIPFGLECQETIDINMHQVQNVPKDVKRIVVPCGSGMNMISIIKGLDYYGRYDVKVVGVMVGHDPRKTLDGFIHNSLFERCKVNYELVRCPYDYSKKAKDVMIGGLKVDEMYEAKCLPFLEKNDLLWIVGRKIY
jgi:1-aminocyclopropane-1-carboxylate deaminase/D-cysteine desulfhydrase-like pyridoxal-dependent ACC family enzyme